jgi:voltage-gated potassium channel Kch
MQLSLFFPFSPAWVVSRSRDRFIVAFEGIAPLGFVEWLQASGVSVVGVAPLPAWRSFGAGVALYLRVPSTVASVLSAFPSGAGGSFHPANLLPW